VNPPAVTTRPLAVLAVIGLLLLVTGAVATPSAVAAPVPVPAGSGPLTLELTQLTPRVVTDDGPASVTVLGTLHNTGDRTVEALEVRMQRGGALRTDGEVRDALAGTGRADAVTPAFTPLPGTLEPGGELPVQLTVLLRGAPTAGLALTAPGVYEVLVNVNGVPRDGVRARLAAVRLLLPVLSLPAGAGPRGERAVPATPGAAADLTVLYPLVDVPRRLPTVPGEQTLLTDDDLARSLAPEGRLGGLLASFADRAPPGSAVRAATCLGVDPDLVQTAAAMREGYAVRGPTGTVPGTGAEVARVWLDGLSAAARDGCVVALPFADADLVALTRGDLGDLGRLAVADGRTIVTEVLGTPVVDGTTWPVDGGLDEGALADLAAAGGRAVVVGADAVSSGVGAVGAGVGDGQRGTVALAAPGTPPVLAVLADPLLSRASAAPEPVTPRGVTSSVTTVSATANPPLSTQDALATLVFRARGTAGGPLALAPPYRWTADATAARALLDAVHLLLDRGRLRPRGLADVVAAGPTIPGPARRPADPLQARNRDIPPSVVESVREVRADVLDLRAAAVPEAGVGATLDAVFGPLLLAALRPTSAAWYGRPELAAGSAAAATGRVGELRDSIRVLEPPSPYSLATTDAPLLLTVANGLPVTMEVRLSISSTTGLRVAPIPVQRIPALGRRQVQVSAEVVRSGQFAVEATVRTPAGKPLGPPSRLQVRSTAYGTITLWLTGCAGVLLVVLAARRVVRRVRGEAGRTRVGPPVGPSDPSPDQNAPVQDPVGPNPPPPSSTPPRSTPSDPTPPEPELPNSTPDPEPPTRPVPAPRDPEPPTRPVPAHRP
jgi:Family of unknown function (DUF6049)